MDLMKEIPLSHGLFALISDEDYELVSKFKWSAYRIAGTGRNGKTYLYGYKPARKVTVNGKRKMVTLYNYIMEPPAGMEVDHIDQNPLNNTRENMRLADRASNCKNRGKRSNGLSSKYLGVSFNKEKGKFTVKLKNNGISIFVGYFTDEKEAAKAYNDKALETFGEFASLNKIDK